MTGLENNAEIANIKWLRRLVIVLLVVMIVGFIGLLGMFAVRLSAGGGGGLGVPSAIILPSGRAIAVTQTDAFWIVLNDEGKVFVYDTGDFGLRKTLTINDE